MKENKTRQVFQTDSQHRWIRFKWTLRLIVAVALLFLTVFATLFLMERSPQIPFRHDYRSVVTAERPMLRDNSMAKAYKAERDQVHQRQMHNAYQRHDRQRRFVGHGDSITMRYVREWLNGTTEGSPKVRAAWYVNWDRASYRSLKNNLRHLNMVMPEWLFIHPQKGVLEVRLDHQALEMMRRVGIPIMPMLTNNYGGTFRPETIERLLASKAQQQALVEQVVKVCKQHHFSGINLDFEELRLKDNAPFTAFVAQLAKRLHREGLWVTQDIAPFNEDYDVAALANHLDFIFLMAYDEHNATSRPGPISSANWVERATDWAARVVPNEKLVLGLASYGYDWDGEEATTVDIPQALAAAHDAETQPLFDPNTYNLSYAYTDGEGALHHVHLTDAATSFNLMRMGANYPLAGYALWRLGTEDRRLWKFYDSDLSKQAAPQLPLKKIMQMPANNEVHYVGDGEVLKVETEPQKGQITVERDPKTQLVTMERYDKMPASWVVEKLGQPRAKELVLTFDDGPDSRWTPQVLDILRKEGVPAAFFMVGLQMEKNLPLVQRVVKEGHTLGNHTFTHLNMVDHPDRSHIELKLTRMLMECVTGRSTILFRAPYNADADPSDREEIEPMIMASRDNYLFVGESIDPNDWEPDITSHEIVRRVMAGVHNGNGHIILLHDAGGSTRQPTIDALPRIIRQLRKEGYKFVSLEHYMGVTTETLMPSIPKGKTYYAMQANLGLAESIYAVSDFLVALFIVFMVLGFGRLLFMFYLTLREKQAERQRSYPPLTATNSPQVSIIVPAYNEEVNIVRTIATLLKQDYPAMNIVMVDDGSTDTTLEKAKKAFQNEPRVRVLTHPNGGKASALNYGIEQTDAPYVVCIDADTQLKTNAVSQLMRHFVVNEPNRKLPLGAVAGNVKVGNQRNLLTKWQAIEYTTSQNFDRMAYAAINAITVVPGAIGAFDRQAIVAAGGFTTDTLAEDCDLTMRIVEAGYVVENENGAVAMTEAPERLPQFVKQRTRWSFGVMQTFWKHRRHLFSLQHKGYGLWALPNMLVFQYIIPTFSPLADLFMLLGLVTGNGARILLYYLLFLAIDASVSVMAYLFEKERLSVLVWIVPQRFFYRWVMYWVLFRAYLKAIKGELQQWGVLKRTGNVQETT